MNPIFRESREAKEDMKKYFYDEDASSKIYAKHIWRTSRVTTQGATQIIKPYEKRRQKKKKRKEGRKTCEYTLNCLL